MPTPIKTQVQKMRSTLDTVEKAVLALKTFDASEVPSDANTGEMIANIMLAYRHIEDARMRLGKVIQAHDGGESIYDKAPAQE